MIRNILIIRREQREKALRFVTDFPSRMANQACWSTVPLVGEEHALAQAPLS